MASQRVTEENVLSAVREIAQVINAGKGTPVDVSALAEATSQLALSNLDYWERFIRSEYWSALNPKPPKWKFWLKPSDTLTWMDIISWDGYRREHALRSLTGGAPNNFFFALALRRLNDWIPQVREAAREKLPEMVDASRPAHVVDALCSTLSHWNSWGRMDELERAVLLGIISKDRIAEAIKEKIITASSGPMTTILAQIGRTPVIDVHLDEIAKTAVQPALRAKVYRSLFERKLSWFEGRKWDRPDHRYGQRRLVPVVGERSLRVTSAFIEILRSASIDPSPMVKRVAAEMLIRELGSIGDESFALAKLFASDPSPSVAERGAFALERLKA